MDRQAARGTSTAAPGWAALGSRAHGCSCKGMAPPPRDHLEGDALVLLLDNEQVILMLPFGVSHDAGDDEINNSFRHLLHRLLSL